MLLSLPDTGRVVRGNLAEGPKWHKAQSGRSFVTFLMGLLSSNYAVSLMATRSTEEQMATFRSLRMLVTAPSSPLIDIQGALSLPLLVLDLLLG
jgi:hypothetical protein